MQKNQRGDDPNIAVAENVSNTVKDSRNGAQTSVDVKNVDRSININKDFIEHDGVRISPSFMEFKDACEGMTFRQMFIIQNMGKNTAHVRICSPNSIAFQIETLSAGIFLSPGLRILRSVRYAYKRTSVLHAMIPIYINSKYMDYHVICTLAKASLSIEPSSLDFGIVDIGSMSGAKILTLRNDGGKSTRFAIDLGPSGMDLSVKPKKGILQPRSKILLRVELSGLEEGSFFGEFWIKSTPNIQVPVKVNIIIPHLVVYHPNTTGDFTLIDFPPTFMNTVRHDTIILRSNSAQVSNFVVLGEIDNDLIPIKNIDLGKHPAFEIFKIYPIEGRLDPFEGRVFNITFSPSTKVIKDAEEFRKRDRQDFMIFLRLFRVHCTEVEDILGKEINLDDRAEEPLKKLQLFEPDSVESLSDSDNESPESPGFETVRLCLYGETEEARLEFIPNELHLGDFKIGEIVQRELTISNVSHHASVVFKFVPNPSARCTPSSGQIQSQESVQVLITVTGNYNVKVPFKLTFDVIVQTCDLNSLKTCYIKAKPCCLLVWFKLIIPLAKDKRKKASCVFLKIDNPPLDFIMHENPTSISNSLCVNFRYTLSPKEAALRFQHRLYWSNYIKSGRIKKKEVALKLLNSTTSNETDCKDLLIAKLPKIEEPSIASKLLRKAMLSRVLKHANDEVLVALSPLQIYNVKISPTLLAYGLVAPKSMNYRTLRIENLNDFPVMLRLVSRVSNAISFLNGSLIDLHPGTWTTKIVEYRAQRIGKFNTYIDYIINDNHSFSMTITATVIAKSLSLNVREITFGKSYSSREAYQPIGSLIEIKNRLDATTSFTWDLHSNSRFFIHPMSGEVRGNRSLFAEVTYDPYALKCNNNNTEVLLTSESGTRTNLTLDIALKKPDVGFVNDTLNLDRIPLNITTTVIGVLHNAEFREVMFQIDQSSLISGCDVHPFYGIILPRGIINLEVKLKFDACFKFSFTIDVLIQKCFNLGLKILGNVSYPLLKLSPQVISMKRISINAIATHLLTASNVGDTACKVQFLLREHPEFRASLSPHRKDPCVDGEGLMILPGSSVLIYLHFIPTDLASYSFYLPIVINEILGPVSNDSSKSIKPSDFLKSREAYYMNYTGIRIAEVPTTVPTVYIDFTVSGSVVSFNKVIFHFDVMSNMIKDELRVSNPTQQEVSLIIRTDDFSFSHCPFFITWISGVEPNVTELSIVCTLEPGQETRFSIEFKPLKHGNFRVEAPIFVKGELDGCMFNSLLLDGVHLANYVTCDKKDLYFAPVPLGIETEGKLTLRTGQRKNPVEIIARVIKPLKFGGTFSDNCLVVKFLNSHIIGGENSNEELILSVVFRSEYSVGFTTRIEFHVAEAVECFVNVCAIADNSILTTYGFQRGNNEVNGVPKQQERISFPSITSRGENSSSLTNKEFIIPRKHNESVLKRMSVHPSISGVSGVSQRSLKILEAKLKSAQNDDSPSYYNDDNDSEGFSLKSKLSGNIPSVSNNCYKFSKVVFPYFPIIIRGAELENNMQRTITATEQWMYSGGFKFNFYPTIVDGINAVLSGVCSLSSRASERQKAHTVSQSFIDLLISLGGKEVLKYIGEVSLIPKDPHERVGHVLKLYQNVLEFLAAQGALLPHVQSEYLLNYHDYLLNNTQNKSQLEAMSRELFQSRSKQCWLDVVLQTFKTLVLGRIGIKKVDDEANESPSQSNSSVASISESSIKKTSIGLNVTYSAQYSKTEILLLNWLQDHFEKQRNDGWMKDDRTYLNPRENRDSLQSRTVSNFEQDLSDGLILIGVTGAYCPYLIGDHFKNIYITPRNLQEAHHNAACLTTAWRRIRLGFMITPSQIIKPNCVQMLMLVTHLFHTLPSFLPSAKIQFCCPLTETVIRQISFNNATEFPVSYVIEFIGNDMDLFSAVLGQPIVNLKARNAGSLKIRYHARKIAKTKAHVILCGSSVAPHFANNHVFTLEGCTSHLGNTNNYEIQTMLYKVCNETLNIFVPFKEAAEYDISFTEEQPTFPASLKLSRWADLMTRKVPRRLFLNQKTIVVAENSHQSDLSITVACIAPTKRSFWIVFESEIGDFIIQLDSSSKKSITDYITVNWERDTCICSDLANGVSRTCPLNFKIGIPTRNVQLWNCVNEMFQKTLDQKECLFWSRHFDTNIGLRLIHWLMGDHNDSAAKEFTHIFDTAVTYDVTTIDNDNIVVPDKLIVADVRPRDEEIPILVHISESTPQAYVAMIKLSSPDGMEHRTYKINFLCKSPIPPSDTLEIDNGVGKKNKQR